MTPWATATAPASPAAAAASVTTSWPLPGSRRPWTTMFIRQGGTDYNPDDSRGVPDVALTAAEDTAAYIGGSL